MRVIDGHAHLEDLPNLDSELAAAKDAGVVGIIAVGSDEKSNDAALEVLARCSGRHPRYVFSYGGEGIKGVDSETWKRACKKAEIEDFRWHDLRHTWASWHVQAGTSLQTLMELGSWRSYRMVLRYAHLASDHLHAAAANVAPPTEVGGANGASGVRKQLRCKVIPLPVQRRDAVTR